MVLDERFRTRLACSIAQSPLLDYHDKHLVYKIIWISNLLWKETVASFDERVGRNIFNDIVKSEAFE